MQHQASYSPVVHCVWSPHGHGPNEQIQGSQEQARSKQATRVPRVPKTVNSFLEGIMDPQVSMCLQWPCPFWPMTSVPRCETWTFSSFPSFIGHASVFSCWILEECETEASWQNCPNDMPTMSDSPLDSFPVIKN